MSVFLCVLIEAIAVPFKCFSDSVAFALPFKFSLVIFKGTKAQIWASTTVEHPSNGVPGDNVQCYQERPLFTIGVVVSD